VSDGQIAEDWLALLDSMQADSVNPYAAVTRPVPRRVTNEAGSRARAKLTDASSVLLLSPADASDNTAPDKLLLSTLCSMMAVYDEARTCITAHRDMSAQLTSRVAELETSLERQRKIAMEAKDALLSGSNGNNAGLSRRRPSSSPTARRAATPTGAEVPVSSGASPVEELPAMEEPTGPPLPAAGRFSLLPSAEKQRHALDSRPPSAQHQRVAQQSPERGRTQSPERSGRSKRDSAATRDDHDDDPYRPRIVFNVILGDRSKKDEPPPQKFEAGTERCEACGTGVAYVSCPGCWGAKLCGRCCHALHDVLPPALLRRAVHVTPSDAEMGTVGRYGGKLLDVIGLGGSHIRVRDAPTMGDAAGTQLHFNPAVHERHTHYLARTTGPGAAATEQLGGVLQLGQLKPAPRPLSPRDRPEQVSLAWAEPAVAPTLRPASASLHRAGGHPQGAAATQTQTRLKSAVRQAEEALAQAQAAGKPLTAVRMQRDNMRRK
jgi:hypothetical protein